MKSVLKVLVITGASSASLMAIPCTLNNSQATGGFSLLGSPLQSFGINTILQALGLA